MGNAISKFYLKILNISSDFQRIFFSNEYNTLAGKSSKGIITLIIILFFTLMALGFAVGSLRYLDERMNNPFTNWVNMPIAYEVKEQVDSIHKFYMEPVVKDTLKLNYISEYCKFPAFFYHQKKLSTESKKSRIFKKGRTVEPDDDLLKKVLSPTSGNVISGLTLEIGDSFDEDLWCGVIITQKALQELGYEQPANQKKVEMAIDIGIDGYENLSFYFDIIAVVRELPDLASFICTPRFYNLAVLEDIAETGFYEVLGEKYSFSLVTDIADEEAFDAKVKSVLQEYSPNKVKSTPFPFNERLPLYKKELIFNTPYDLFTFREIFETLEKEYPNAKRFNYYNDWNESSKYDELKNPYELAFNFTTTDKVRDFKNSLFKKFGIEINMSQVESKENFALVSRLTFFISVVLFIFGTTSIVFFVDSLLRTHMEKVKTNLGTFKAFGLSNQFLIGTYSKIILTFLSQATIIAFVLAAFVTFVQSFFVTQNYFNLYNIWILLAIIGLFIISTLISRRTISRILTNTPGDLIYNRI